MRQLFRVECLLRMNLDATGGRQCGRICCLVVVERMRIRHENRWPANHRDFGHGGRTGP